MDDPESVNSWLANVFFDHNVSCVAPPRNCNSPKNNDVHKFDETIEEKWMFDKRLVVPKMTT
jgi:hypothetical protein